MSAGSFAESSTLERTPAEPAPVSEPRRRPVLRFAIAVTASAAVCLVVWLLVPRTLSGRIDVVGFPTFADWDLYPSFWAYRLATYIFPALAILFYLLLRWRGPLRRPRTPRPRGPIMLRERAAEGPTTDRPAAAAWLGIVPRLALPTGVVVVAAATRTGHIRAFAIVCGLVYLVAVVTAAAAVAAVSARRTADGRIGAFRRGLATVNAIASIVAAFAALWYVSWNTTVTLPTGTVRYEWAPWWLAGLGALAVLWWTLDRLLRRGRSAAEVEKTILTVVVGAVSLFLAISFLNAEMTWLQGYDGGQDVAGARLLDDGYFPWRDFMFIHGLWDDALKANIGMAVFGQNTWAASAGITVLWWPLCWVSVFLFAAWLTKRNPWFLAVIWVAAFSGYFLPIDNRFILVPVTFVVFGEALRRNGGLWYVGLTVLLFVQSVLIPEMAFLTAPALVCIVAVDLVHREPGVGIWRALRRTRWTAATGVVCIVVLCAVLAAYHALGAFIAYYRVFGPGHNETGAIPPVGLGHRDYLFFAAGIVAVLFTVWDTIRRVLRRGTWEPLDWVTLAAAGFVALYGEKALGRFDLWHIVQVFDVAIPLVLIWLWRILREINLGALRLARPQLRWSPILANTTTALLLVIALVGLAHPLRLAAGNVDKQHAISASYASYYPGVGPSGAGAVNAQAVADLQTALNAYGGPDAPVFDMTNSIEYTYYLMRRVPATRFVHVSMAIPQYAQQLLISDLEKSRPPVIIYDAAATGLPIWDGIATQVRHYEVSDYILKGWVPVLRTHGNLLLLRRDLAAEGTPVPALIEPPQTADLWFNGPACGWGYSAAFLQSLPVGQSVSLPVRSVKSGTKLDLSGWAADRTTHQASKTVVIATGDTAVTTIAPFVNRPDVQGALGLASSLVGFTYSGILDSDTTPTVYLLAGDGKLHPFNGTAGKVAPSVRMPDGQVLATDPNPLGYLDMSRSGKATVGQVDVPAGGHLADYSLATFSAGGRSLGTADFEITDAPGQVGHSITASSLATQGNDLSVRVGSCIQWHGYDSTKPLYVVQSGGAPATTVTLSGVKE